jgi:regulator of sirC expression with transglutaminase-like and TPR domain
VPGNVPGVTARGTAFNLQARPAQVAEDLRQAMRTPGPDLATAALTIARIEYPTLDCDRYLRLLERMGAEAAARVARAASGHDVVRALNHYLYDDLGFRGNSDHYDDSRNSFLNEVLDRRTGIPISLAIVYIEVARRAGLRVEGVNFPGHFLLRVPATLGPGTDSDAFLVVDPFHDGTILDRDDCEQLYQQHGGDAELDDRQLEPATRPQIVARTLMNLKRLYVRMRSFPQARLVSELLLAVDPSSLTELRDRGLLAYHLEDFHAALRDLESYLRLSTIGAGDTAAAEGENGQIAEQVQTLRRRVAALN